MATVAVPRWQSLVAALNMRALQDPGSSLFLMAQVRPQDTREDSVKAGWRLELQEAALTSRVSNLRGCCPVRRSWLSRWRGGECCTASVDRARSKRRGQAPMASS